MRDLGPAAERACRPGPTLTWAPPAMTAPETIPVTTANRQLSLDVTKDYVLDLGDQPIQGGMRVTGGRNVVIVGGHIEIPRNLGRTGVALSIRRQAQGGTVHVEGVRFSGAVHDAINLEQPNDTTVQLQNLYVDELHAMDERRWDTHPDLVQTWTGPDVLRIDRLTGYTPYQGLFLEPDDQVYRGVGNHNIPRLADIRNVNIRVRPDRGSVASRLLWQSTPFPLTTRNLWLDPGRGAKLRGSTFPPGRSAWRDVRRGVPPGGNFVQRWTAGAGYVSPGYGGARVCRARRSA